ncbi:response regulator [Flavobacterium psychroterrae]|uniref:Response regulator n=1 Tax=Flavobacterium psychroterrae TaxID=2133767 RepID=A0ABS5P7F6_9FLAO|nr:response regulator [Flavobacterium psychroterrae]MBS7229735.1 response regulator [Flavobacterium psychroterrae]
MNHISILLVDDDFNKISSIIRTIKEVFDETLSINQASCVQEAIENLQNKEYHLLITDLQMPLKYDDQPNDNGGQVLIKQLYRNKSKVNVPMYIVGLTQFEELKNNFEGIWKIWHFEPSSEIWKNNLRDLIFHISLVKSRVKANKIETIFLEGPTDKNIIESCLKHFFENEIDKVYLETINYGGGASWVQRQLFIWAKSLTIKTKEEKYLKAVGIFDDDEAGKIAIDNLISQIEPNSAEKKTFSILKNSYKYSVLLKSIKSKGITFQTTIEDLISIDCWKAANANGWLISRDLKKTKIDSSILKLKNLEISEKTLRESNFTEDEILLTINKVNDDYKKQFSNMVCTLDKENLLSIKYLLEDAFKKLKIDLIT